MHEYVRLLWQAGLLAAGGYLYDIFRSFAYGEIKSPRFRPGADRRGFKNIGF